MWMEKQGEPAFRDLESAALKNLSNEKESVVALGGGALLRDENRNFVESNGKVLLLMAELSTLLERLHYESGNRPLLAGDLREKLSSLLNKRGEHYNSFAMSIHVDGKTAEQNAHKVQVMLGRHHLFAMGEYDAIVGQVSDLPNFPMQNPIIVTDENVAKFHLEKMQDLLQAKAVIIPDRKSVV